jgi:ParB family chromosome partitioning protein
MSSKFKELAGKTAGIQPRTVEKTHERPAKTAPVMLYDATARMHAAEQRAEELEARLRDAEKNGASLEVALADLHEVPGRKRSLTDEQFQELRNNLRNNELVTPITVRPRAQGGYEIISGHNRVRAYRELGRVTIAAVVRDTDAARADINAFYANLLQPTLPDYEKYLGFRLIRGRHPDFSQEQIAEMAGVSQSLLSRLLSFEELPQDVHEILAKHPNSLGATAASNLAALTKQGRTAKVTEAVRKIAEEGLDQTTAVNLAAKDEDRPKPKAAVEVTTYKVGKAPLCSYRKTDTTLRVDFKSSEHAEAVHGEIQKVLEKYAASRKTGKK